MQSFSAAMELFVSVSVLNVTELTVDALQKFCMISLKVESLSV